MNKSFDTTLFYSFIILLLSTLSYAQYSINQKIEVEDLYDDRVILNEAPDTGNDWLRVSHGEGWVEHPNNPQEWYPSNFIYAMCGNRHWLCDYRTIIRCLFSCSDVYVSVPVTIPEDGEYVVYAYVSVWSDSAVIAGNEGCEHGSKWECCGWFVAWDDVGLLDKVKGEEEYNVSIDYLWKVYPYQEFCDRFSLDTVVVGYEISDCPGRNPDFCDFPGTRFNLTVGEHTLYLKVAEEYTLLDWIWVAKDGDPPPEAVPGRDWQQSTDIKNVVTHRPEQFKLLQNYPNPFNATTRIENYLPRTSNVNLVLYNISGQKISVLVDGVISRGHHSLTFDANELPSGTYWYRLRATCTGCGGKDVQLFTQVRDMILVK